MQDNGMVRDIGKAISCVKPAQQTLRTGCLFKSAVNAGLAQWLEHNPKVRVIDFRSPKEADRHSIKLHQIGNLRTNVPIMVNFDNPLAIQIRDNPDQIELDVESEAVKQVFHKIYEDMATNFNKEWKLLFRILLDVNFDTFVLVCRRGIDRSGTGVNLILNALGYSQSAITAEYCSANSKSFPPKASYYNIFYEAIISRYGSFPNFLMNGLNLTDEEIYRLRDKFSYKKAELKLCL